MLANLGDLFADEAADFRPEDGVEALELLRGAEDLAAEDTAVDEAVFADGVMPEGVDHLLESGRARFVGTMPHAIGVDDDGAVLAELLSGCRFPGGDAAGQANHDHLRCSHHCLAHRPCPVRPPPVRLQ